MTSTTYSPSNCIAWIFSHGSSESLHAKIHGIFYEYYATPNKSKNKKLLEKVLAKDNFDADYICRISDFVYPQNERDEISANSIIEGNLKTGEAHKVMVKFEDNEVVAEACRDAEDEEEKIKVWIVLEPDITGVKEFQDVDLECMNWKKVDGKDGKTVKDVIFETICPGRPRFNAGALGTAVSSFTHVDDAMRHAKKLLGSKTGTVVDMLSSERGRSWGAVVTESHGVEHLVSVIGHEPVQVG